jgi:hypothetical protein
MIGDHLGRASCSPIRCLTSCFYVARLYKCRLLIAKEILQISPPNKLAANRGELRASGEAVSPIHYLTSWLSIVPWKISWPVHAKEICQASLVAVLAT